MSEPTPRPSVQPPARWPDDELAALVALHAVLDGVNAHQIANIAVHGPRAVLESLRAGVVPAEVTTLRSDALERSWVADARACDPPALLEAHRAAGVWIAQPADVDWPFPDDRGPTLLFGTGDRRLLAQDGSDAPRVAIVGTRRCTAIGRQVAVDLGRGLSELGVDVVSGLALGIDGAAHRGVLDAWAIGPDDPDGGRGLGHPLAVVAGGVDVVYPRRHRSLFAEVRERGLIVSEAALGVGVEPWRFLARNRLIAAMADLVVVVESHAKGGALNTSTVAAEIGVTVGAVPGSVLSPAAEGTNHLLDEGAAMIRGLDDVVRLLDLEAPSRSDTGRAGTLGRSDWSPLERRVVTEVRAGTDRLERLAGAVGEPLPAVLAAVTRLELAGDVRTEGQRVVPGTSPGRRGR